MVVLKGYYRADQMRLCPSATLGLDPKRTDAYGGARKVWGPMWDGTFGSYGINHYLYGYVPNIWTKSKRSEIFLGQARSRKA